MLRPFTQIQITQIPTPKWPDRKSVFVLDFNTEYSIESNWESHTNNAEIKFPKNIALFGTPDGIFAKNGTFNNILSGSGTDLSPNIDAFGQDVKFAPLIMKGDIVTINYGYIFRNAQYQDAVVSTGGITIGNLPINNKISFSDDLFFGYVSAVGSDTPITLKLEDNFYLLKRTPFPKSVWNKTTSNEVGVKGTSLYELMQYILDLTNDSFVFNPNNKLSGVYPKLTLLNIPTSITAQFSLGYLDIGDMTCAEVFNKLQQQYHMISTFRGNVLQFGFPIYTDAASVNQALIPITLQANSNNFFCFRDIFNTSGLLQASGNIFNSHDLEYSNKDDIELSATVECKVINVVPGKSTLSGAQKTKVEKLKVIVNWDIPTSSFKVNQIKVGQIVPLKDGGERHQFFYPVDNTNPNPTIKQLGEYGIQHLQIYHYTGFRGCFTTFGFPFVQWNDNVNIIDSIYADRNGQYKIKEVKYKGGLHGLSQEIHLDYKTDRENNALPQVKNPIYML